MCFVLILPPIELWKQKSPNSGDNAFIGRAETLSALETSTSFCCHRGRRQRWASLLCLRVKSGQARGKSSAPLCDPTSTPLYICLPFVNNKIITENISNKVVLVAMAGWMPAVRQSSTRLSQPPTPTPAPVLRVLLPHPLLEKPGWSSRAVGVIRAS